MFEITEKRNSEYVYDLKGIPMFIGERKPQRDIYAKKYIR